MHRGRAQAALGVGRGVLLVRDGSAGAVLGGDRDEIFRVYPKP